MRNKAEVLMHPVRMKILQALMHDKEEGLSTLEMISIIKDVPQATLYRHIQILMDENIIKIVKERKVRSVTEKFYALNEGAEKLSQEDWTQLTIKQKLNYVSNYQLALLSQYQNYLNSLDEEERLADLATFSFIDLTLTTTQFMSFENELNDLIIKYYNMADSSKETETKTIAINIIPKP
ncbi:helix-turn-helix domain-containing protein [Lysinibacillus sp. CNPSo 3705]|uniref:helix-turn-helix domain-containing protein n=1 Tax=Lysinibacillus sp. CNPSo 3705 TaxID=3028148 RepID=UPI002363A346|nr:helix-turn-helix domain-containing protein [Lysinibacillus sp. CNPSo 3705]MDD1503708.1 helix-turn-helix domain-containing protein [Lysinibacillus sp. CNPSo 3705]